jgi:hypothetical protein
MTNDHHFGLFGKESGPKALPPEISRFLNKSKTASEFGQKAVGFMDAKMSISYVKDRPIMAVGSPLAR